MNPGEYCDDGNIAGTGGCSATCTVNPNYQCNNSPYYASVCLEICGDGRNDGHYACDDGNNESGDGCSRYCVVEQGFTCTHAGAGTIDVCKFNNPVCGNGRVEPPEECDDYINLGNAGLLNGDGCSTTCTIEVGFECHSGNLA